MFLMGCMKVKTKVQLPGVPDGLYEGEEQLPGVLMGCVTVKSSYLVFLMAV